LRLVSLDENFALWQLFEIERWQPEISCQKIQVEIIIFRFYYSNLWINIRFEVQNNDLHSARL
jgi:hypothetical protein